MASKAHKCVSRHSYTRMNHGSVVKASKGGRKFVSKPDEDMKPGKYVTFKGKRYYIDGRVI